MKPIPQLVACIALFSAGTVQAQVPRLINYQGRIAVDAVNFDGTGHFKFALVDTTGAITFWSNDGTGVAGGEPAQAVSLAVSKGLYSVLLGDTALNHMTALSPAAFVHPDVRLRVWFNDGVTGFQLLAPDQRLAPASYLADGTVTSAAIADAAISATKIAAGTIDGTRLAPASLDFTRLQVPTAPAAGQVLSFNGTSLHWIPAAGGSGDSVFSLNGTSACYSGGDVGIGTNSPTNKLDVRGNITIDSGSNAAIFTGTGNTDLNRHLTLINSMGRPSASGLKAGGVLVADSYSYADPGKNDLIVKGIVGIGEPSPTAPLDIYAEWVPNETPNINLTGKNPTVQWRAYPGFPHVDQYFKWIAHVGSSQGLEFWNGSEDWGTLPIIRSDWSRRLLLTWEGDIHYAGKLGAIPRLFPRYRWSVPGDPGADWNLSGDRPDHELAW